MTGEKRTKQDRFMDKLFNRYIKQITSYANVQFDAYVLPWLIKYHVEMYSGNGETFLNYTENTPKWFIRKYRERDWEDPMRLIDRFKIPLKVRTVIDSIVPGVNGSLGEFMPDLEIKNGRFRVRKTN